MFLCKSIELTLRPDCSSKLLNYYFFSTFLITKDFEALLASRKPQYVFLDEDDIIDVTGRPDLQEQFLKGADLEQKETDKPAHSAHEENESNSHFGIFDDRDFGYLDDLLSDDKESPFSSEPQRQKDNYATGFGFQVSFQFQHKCMCCSKNIFI